MRRSTLTPFFWAKLASTALAVGLLGASGCSAGGGDGDDLRDPATSSLGETPSSSPAAPSSPAPASATTPSSAGTTSQNAAQNAGGGIPPVSDTTLDDPSNDDEPNVPAPAGEVDDNGGDDDDEPNVPTPAGDDDNDDDDDDEGGVDDDDEGGDDDDDEGGDDDDDEVDAGEEDPGNEPPVVNPVPTPVPNDAPTFTADIRPILVTNCGRCHSSGGLPNFASANAATGYDVAVGERNEIVRLITNGDMPADTCGGGAPGSNGCVSVANLALIREWVAAGTPE